MVYLSLQIPDNECGQEVHKNYINGFLKKLFMQMGHFGPINIAGSALRIFFQIFHNQKRPRCTPKLC